MSDIPSTATNPPKPSKDTNTPVTGNPDPTPQDPNTPTPVTGAPSDPTAQADVAWHKEACAEAVFEHNAARLVKTAAAKGGSVAQKAVFIRSDRLWDNGVVLNCGFMVEGTLNAFQTRQQAKVRKVAVEWSDHANITLNFVEDITKATVRITFDPDSGSWSFVGKEVSSIKPEDPTMNLGWIDGSSDVISPSEYGVILHEFGHTLGLMHEHQSPLRGNKITLKEDAVIRFYTSSQGWTADEVRAQILNVYNKNDVSNYSDVDLTSIMQYFMPPQLNEQGIRVDPNNKLSELDKAFMAINYPSFGDAKDGKRAQFEAALGITGVVGSQKANILKLYDARNWLEVRYEFTRFCTDMHVARKAALVAPAVEPPVVPKRGVEPKEDGGCRAEDDEDDNISRKGASKAVATREYYLWLPGEVITYSYVQGSGEATEYRQKRIRETFDFYSACMNIKFEEIPYEPQTTLAKIRIWFGNFPDPMDIAWCKIGNLSIPYRQEPEKIAKRGGNEFTTFAISEKVMPKVAPTDENLIIKEKMTLFHETGHALGLKHEHNSPYTPTIDKPDVNVSAATVFDEKSIMLYPNCEYRDGSGKTVFNHVPSTLDIAFLGALYPNRKGHVDDHFGDNMKDLGLTGSQTALDALRDAAFAVEGHAEFADKIKAYRQALQEKLAANAAQRAAMHAPIPPSNFRAPRDVVAEPPSTASQGSFLAELVKNLQAIFKPSTGQMFALQFPGRFLQKDLYAWDTNTAGIYGQFVKPTVVNESEFRLVDQLYNVGSVVGAPNGMNLSIIYEQCLNNLIPGVTKPAINLSKQQSQIRQWLLKDVPTSGWVEELLKSQTAHSAKGASSSGAGGKTKHGAKASRGLMDTSDGGVKAQFAVADRLTGGNHVNRMELSDALMQEYLSAKQAWELERDEMIKNTKDEDMDALTRKLAHITAVREAQLASKHADAVVRGYSHAIRQYLGFLDVKSPAEFLQDAKDALRESAVSSLDGSMKVYPVQLSPIDWFEGLSTSFTMEDLTINPEIIAQQIDLKSKQLDVLNTRLAVVQSKPKTDIQAIQDKLDQAQATYDQAQMDLSLTYTSNVISLAKTFIDANDTFQFEAFKGEARKSKIADAAFANIDSGMKKLSQAQLSVTQQSRALTLLRSQKSLAEASDTTQECIEISVQITALQKDLAELTTRLKTLRYSANSASEASADQSKSVKDVDLHPPISSAGGSRWQDIYMKHDVENKYSTSSDSTKVKTTNTDCPLFFGSYHSESHETSADSSASTSAKSVSVEIGFRATMVTVDRGGWFQPQFFKQSAGFHSIDSDMTWSRWPEKATLDDFANDASGKLFSDLNKHLLPAFPVSFIICKDITIRIHMSQSDIQTHGKQMEKYAASSAGILCWSTNSNEHEKSSDKSLAFSQKADGCIIRIPGPQILGYMLQYTDPDKTKPIPEKLPDDFLLSDADYDLAFNAPKAGHTVDPSTAAPQPTPAPK